MGTLPDSASICERAGCDSPLPASRRRGSPRRFCSSRCRWLAWSARQSCDLSSAKHQQSPAAQVRRIKTLLRGCDKSSPAEQLRSIIREAEGFVDRIERAFSAGVLTGLAWCGKLPTRGGVHWEAVASFAERPREAETGDDYAERVQLSRLLEVGMESLGSAPWGKLDPGLQRAVVDSLQGLAAGISPLGGTQKMGGHDV
jgi:hypothetical protein